MARWLTLISTRMGLSRRNLPNTYQIKRLLPCNLHAGALQHLLYASSAHSLCVSRTYTLGTIQLADPSRTVGWKFYLLFILLTFIGGFVVLFTFPDTRFLPLEEIAAIFGDTDEVAIYQAEIEVDHNTHGIVDHHGEKAEGTHIETSKV